MTPIQCAGELLLVGREGAAGPVGGRVTSPGDTAPAAGDGFTYQPVFGQSAGRRCEYTTV